MIVFGTNVHAQRLEIREVPESVLIAFRKANPGVGNPQWRKEKGQYQAKCMVDKRQRTFNYTKSGTPIVTDGKTAVTILPPGVKQYLDKNHRGVPVDKVIKIISAEKLVTYTVEVAGTDLVFDGNGKYLKSNKIL